MRSVTGGLLEALGILLRQRRNRHHLAVITLAAQPAEKRAFEQFRVKPVGLGAPVLARYGYAGCVNDMGFDTASPEPARQPEAGGPIASAKVSLASKAGSSTG